MKLKSKVASLDEVPEAYRGLYSKVGEEFFLTEVDVEDHPSTAGLRSTLSKLREEVGTHKSELAKFKNIDPAKYAELTELERQAAEGELIKAGKLDEVVAQRFAPAKKALEDKIAELTALNSKHLEDINGYVLDRAGREACEKYSVEPTAVEDVLRRIRSVARVKDMQPIIVDADGNEVFGKTGVAPKTIAEFVEGLATEAPHLFKKSDGGGAPGSTGGRQTGVGSVNVNDQKQFLANLDKIAKGQVPVTRR